MAPNPLDPWFWWGIGSKLRVLLFGPRFEKKVQDIITLIILLVLIYYFHKFGKPIYRPIIKRLRGGGSQ